MTAVIDLSRAKYMVYVSWYYVNENIHITCKCDGEILLLAIKQSSEKETKEIYY